MSGFPPPSLLRRHSAPRLFSFLTLFSPAQVDKSCSAQAYKAEYKGAGKIQHEVKGSGCHGLGQFAAIGEAVLGSTDGSLPVRNR